MAGINLIFHIFHILFALQDPPIHPSSLTFLFLPVISAGFINMPVSVLLFPRGIHLLASDEVHLYVVLATSL